jgi:DNA-binding response OmpR family regulator
MSTLGTVLIIDDEAALRQTLSRVLERAGCRVSSAADGRQAFDLLADVEFDLVYLDIHLPHMDGMEILRRIRQQHQRLPVVLLTGHGTIQSAVEALRLGATDYLLKPLDPEVLVSRTRTILRERAIQKRRREIREQIMELQTELDTLDRESSEYFPVGHYAPQPDERFLKKGRLILDLQAGKATLGDEVLALPPAAFDYLKVLARYSPDVVSYQNLVYEAQNYKVEASEARELAKWHIHMLRRVIEDKSHKKECVLNVRGVGYRLIIE